MSGSVFSYQRGERVDVGSLTYNPRGSTSLASKKFEIDLGSLDRGANGTSYPST